MPTVARMMQLSAPSDGQKPVRNRSTAGALTGKKPAPIKKFKEAEEAPPESAKKETPFGTWLRKFVTELESKGGPMLEYKQQAYAYILEGAPFRGESLYGVKDQLKDAGATFAQNKEKKEGCDDATIKRGWWAAGDDATLFRMLNLERDERGRHLWTCLDLGHTQMSVLVCWLRSFSKETGAVMQEDTESAAIDASVSTGGKRKRKGALNEEDLVPDWIRAAANGKHLTPWVPEPTCVVCYQKVTDQFLDCGCNGAVWTRCPKCTAIYRPGAPAPHAKCKC